MFFHHFDRDMGTIFWNSRFLKKIIENNGGNVTGTVSKKTNVVIVGDSPGSKYDDAVKLNIEIWNEDVLIEKLGGIYE